MQNPAIRQYSFYAIIALFFLTPIGSLAFTWSEWVSTEWVLLLGGDLPVITYTDAEGAIKQHRSVAMLLSFE